MGLRQRLVQQFGDPNGAVGRVVGFIMSHRPSNLERIAWAVSLLDVEPSDSVLEIGYGPGIAIGMIANRATEGVVYGIDRSELMYEQASRRNKDLVRANRVKLYVGPVSRLPHFERTIDKVLDINAFQFWEDQISTLKALKTLLRPDGRIVIVHQPRNARAKERDAVEAGEKIATRLTACGYQEIKVELRRMKPVAAVCVVGRP